MLAELSSDELRNDDFAFVYLDVDNPEIAWLAYRGIIESPDINNINPGNISWFLVNILKRGVFSTIRREGLIEGVRRKRFPHAISRLSCVYAFPTLEDAQKGSEGQGKFHRDNLVAIAPASRNFQIEKYDSNLISNYDSLEAQDASCRYWSSKSSQEPHYEYLLRGRFYILGTKVRERAYRTIKAIWPKSLALLELSRLAVDLGSQLGCIAPWLTRQGRNVSLEHIVYYEENEGLRVLETALKRKSVDRSYAINLTDLEPLRQSADDRNADDYFRLPGSTAKLEALSLDNFDQLISFIEDGMSII